MILMTAYLKTMRLNEYFLSRIMWIELTLRKYNNKIKLKLILNRFKIKK